MSETAIVYPKDRLLNLGDLRVRIKLLWYWVGEVGRGDTQISEIIFKAPLGVVFNNEVFSVILWKLQLQYRTL